MNSARILLVDDEVSLLHLLEKYLLRLGHRVEPHSQSEQALRSFEASPKSYDLVIADVGMPGIPGDTMLARMLEIKPDLLVLVCSGSPFAVSSLSPARKSQVGFLLKPFVPRMLAEEINRLLSKL